MRVKKAYLFLSLILILAVGITVPIIAASNVAESDWIAAPSNVLVKCEGGDCDHTKCDYVYSFAVVGDTQNLNYKDAQNYVAALQANPALTYAGYTQAYMRTLYNWILGKQEELNIRYVMGVGDITQSFNTSQTYYDEEWALAKEAVSLLDGKLGYSLVRGNHDISSGLNAQFGVGTTYYDDLVALSETTDAEGRPMGGFRDATKIEDSYRKIAAGNNKYIIFTLEYYPTEETVVWLNELLAANSDYTAVITLHAFLNSDRTFLDDHETTTPAEDATKESWAQTATGGNVSPRSLWERVLSKHANVQLVIGGHIDVDDVLTSKMQGDNGNTVTFMLTDPQTIDSSTPVGVVTMLYFSADGKVAHVEHISTVRDAAGKNAYLKEKNQFTLALDYSDGNGSGWTATKYGELPTEQYNNKTFHVFVDDDGVAENDSFYYGSYATLSDAIGMVVEYRATGGLAVREKKHYVILMSKDYTNTDFTVTTVTQSPGYVTLDMGGHTITSSNYLLPIYNRSNEFVQTFTFKNGNLIQAGDKSAVLLQTTQSYIDAKVNIRIEDVNVSYKNSSAPLVSYYAGKDDGSKAQVDLKVTNCTVDTTGASGAVTIFDLADSRNNNEVSLTLNGLNVIGTTAANTVLYTKNNDEILALPNENGNALTVSLTEKAELNDTTLGVNGGSYVFGAPTEQNGRYIYSLQLFKLEETEYGSINSIQYPAKQYPFALFVKGQQSAVFVSASWKDTLTEAKTYLTADTSSATILVRSDASEASADYAWASLHGELTVDLGGNTLTVVTNLLKLNKGGSYDTNIEFKNGNISFSGNGYLIFFGSSATSSAAQGSECNVTFSNVNIGYASDANPNNGNPWIKNMASSGAKVTVGNVIFEDCVLDFKTNAPSREIVFANLSGDDNCHSANIVLDGGEMIYPATKFTLFILKDSTTVPDTFKFSNLTTGKYPTVLANGALPTDKFDTTEGYKAVFGDVGDRFTLVPAEFKLLGAYLNITENINVCYTAGLPAGYTDPYMVFDFNGDTYKVTKYTVDANGKLVFKFVGVTPQMLGDNIKATLYATKGDEVYSDTVENYSVLTYCKNMLNKTDDAKLITLLSDLLVYGAKSQIFADYKTDALVTDGVEGLTPSTFTEVTKTDMALIGTKNDSVTWKSAALRYENAMAMKFTFKADANLVLKVTINGRTTTYKVSELKADEDTGYYTVYFRGILATEYDDVVTAAFYNGDTQVGQSVTYSVNSYVKSKQNDSNEALAELVKATYNYGRAAELYVGQ